MRVIGGVFVSCDARESKFYLMATPVRFPSRAKLSDTRGNETTEGFERFYRRVNDQLFITYHLILFLKVFFKLLSFKNTHQNLIKPPSSTRLWNPNCPAFSLPLPFCGSAKEPQFREGPTESRERCQRKKRAAKAEAAKEVEVGRVKVGSNVVMFDLVLVFVCLA